MSSKSAMLPTGIDRVLGACVSCGGPARAYTGATAAGEGKYMCAACTTTRKASTKLQKQALARSGRALRRDYPEPPSVEGARWLQLGDNQMALVDAADFKRANAKNWFLLAGHAVRRERWGGKWRHNFLHHFVLGLDADPALRGGDEVAFIDNNPLNCRQANLCILKKGAPVSPLSSP